MRRTALQPGARPPSRKRKAAAGTAGSTSGRIPPQGADTAALPRWPAIAVAAIIIAAGAAVYSNSFAGPEILDDPACISQNPHIRSLWPITEAMKAPSQQTTAGRPIVCLSLAVNYRISGLNVWSYHAFNLMVHILAGLAMFGIVRRTLRTERLAERFGPAADVLAGICALVWVVHPLQSQAVDYIIQRAESIMGLMYLLTMYCAIRSFHSRRRLWWQVAAVACCAAGMGTKEVMVSAPLMVIIYDRVFVARSFRETFSKRWRLHAGLAVTWAILAAILITGPRSRSAGFGLDMSPFQYAQAQCGIVLHYVRLAFWPDPLVLDYAWPLPQGLTDVALPAAGVLALLGGTVVALRRRPEVGFLGAWFFLILGPSSSFVPIKDLAFEHRMYLSLAAVTAGVVLCVYAVGRRLAGQRAVAFAAAGLLAAIGVSAALGWRTHLRNEDYSSAERIWSQTVSDAPHNPRAHNNLGFAYHRQKLYPRALEHYDKAIELDDAYTSAYSNRGLVRFAIGDYDRAIADITKAIELRPGSAGYYNDRAAAYAEKDDAARALADLDKAIELDPNNKMARDNRETILSRQRQRR